MSSAPHPVRGPPGSWEPPQSSPEPLRHSGPTVSHPAFCLLLTMYSRSMNGSFTATTLTPFSMQARSTRRPMRPNLPGRRLGVCPQSPQPAGRGGGREGGAKRGLLRDWVGCLNLGKTVASLCGPVSFCSHDLARFHHFLCFSAPLSSHPYSSLHSWMHPVELEVRLYLSS